MSENKPRVEPSERLPAEKLPAPIQLTPDQLKEVAGGNNPVRDSVIRKGIPAAL